MVSVEWEAPEFEYYPKTVSWYWISIIATTLVIAVAVWQKNFLFGMFAVVAEMLLLVWAAREPRMLTFSANEQGLEIRERKRYPYAEIQDFGIAESMDESRQRIILRFRGRFKAPVRVLVPTATLPAVQKLLAAALPQVEIEETFFDAIERFLRF